MQLEASPPTYLEQVSAELCLRSLRHFISEAWAQVEPGVPFVPGWHLDAKADHLQACEEGKLKNLIIAEPPRCMKSLAVSVFWPAWAWARRPHTGWLYASYNASLTVRDATRSRRLIESPWYQRRFPHVRLSADQNQKSRFETTATGLRIATSTSPGALGTGEGGDFLVVDDAHRAQDAYSKARRQSTVDWYRGTWSSRFKNISTVVRVVMGQRIAEDDLTGELLREGGWDRLILPMEYRRKTSVYVEGYRTGIGWSDPRAKEGELLWDARFPRLEVEKLRTSMKPFVAAAQLDQSPVPLTGNMLSPEKWKLYAPYQLPAAITMVLIGVDSNFEDGADNDYFSAHAVAIAGAQVFVLDEVRGLWSFTQALSELRALIGRVRLPPPGWGGPPDRWPGVNAVVVEKAANGAAILSTLRTHARLFWHVNVIDEAPVGSKEARAAAWLPLLDGGAIHLPAEAPWLSAFMEEMRMFPRGEYDDRVDSLGWALYYARHWLQQQELLELQAQAQMAGEETAQPSMLVTGGYAEGLGRSTPDGWDPGGGG